MASLRILTRLVVVTGLLLGVTAVSGPGTAGAATDATINVDGQSAGRTFDGIGGLSAGASSRLLYDYPDPERSQILDYLFKPGYGAAMQVLKVEIGGDTDSTDGAEPSHMRAPGDLDCDRGYEWWLMEEAKARNPNIKLYGLEWGAPGYFSGGFWSRDNIDYIKSWLGCAQRHGLSVDYVGGWNESGFDKGWYEQLDQALATSYPNVRIVAADQYQNWSVGTALRQDPAFAEAVDVAGAHDSCTARTLYQHCPSSADAQALDMPLWDSETSSEAHDVGAGPIARSLNRDYLDGRMTAHIYWSLIAAWYPDLPIADTGLMLAEWPWSGYYSIGSSIWSIAQTTQFTEPGWRYLDSGSGYLDGGASYVSLRSPDSGDHTTVVETMDATEPTTVRVATTGGLSDGTVHEWATDLTSTNQSDYFVHVGDVDPAGGSYQATLQPGHVYTFTTMPGHKGLARPSASAGEQLPVPFQENFDGYRPEQLARYFSDVNGAFQTEPCRNGRAGTCYEQVVSTQPIAWNGRGNTDPSTVFGDPRWWGDYTVRTDVLPENSRYVELWGRVERKDPGAVSGYRLRLMHDGSWQLLGQDASGTSVSAARGTDCSACAPHAVHTTRLAAGRAAFDPDSWHQVALRFRGDQITVLVDGAQVGEVRDRAHTAGQAGLAVSGWDRAQFDDVAVTPSGPTPQFVPQADVSATATTAHTANYRGYTFDASRAVDDRPETYWHSEFQPHAPLPQSITLDLGGQRSVNGLSYQPRLDGSNGMMTAYDVSVSDDGSTYTPVASGNWAATTSTKFASWPERSARYVRLTATAGVGGFASAAEIRVAQPPTSLPPS
ncbi:MAG: discoidin domain-containing protein [Streptosporangiales bacterium]|nr:discoidin domain-containing protein [Streptosporangiales bacterium]MBO0890714.1 discoidin domain-containing protein [Acidothermales bacterium]